MSVLVKLQMEPMNSIISYPVDFVGALTTKGLGLEAFDGMKSLKTEHNHF